MRCFLALLALAAGAPALAAHVYVSNEDDGSVSVIDTARGEAVGSIPVGKRPRGLKFDPQTGHLLVAVSGLPKCAPSMPESACAALTRDPGADGIAVVDLATAKVGAVLPAGSDPEQFDLAHDGRHAFIANEDASRVSVLDIARGTVATTVSVGREPEGVRVAPSGRWVLVTSETESAVSVIDARSLKLVRSIKVGLRPRDMAFTSNSAAAYVTGEADASIYRVDIRRGTGERLLQLRPEARPMGVLLDERRRRLYVATGRGGTVAVVSLRGDAHVEREIAVGARPWGLALSTDGMELYTANGSSNDVTVVDTLQLAVKRRIPVGRSPWGVVLGP